MKKENAPEGAFRRRRVPGSAPRRPTEQVDDRQQDDGADERHEDRPDREAVIDGANTDERRDQPAPDEGADDADDHVQKDALLSIRLHDEAGEPAHDTAHDEPENEIHTRLLCRKRRC